MYRKAQWRSKKGATRLREATTAHGKLEEIGPPNSLMMENICVKPAEDCWKFGLDGKLLKLELVPGTELPFAFEPHSYWFQLL